MFLNIYNNKQSSPESNAVGMHACMTALIIGLLIPLNILLYHALKNHEHFESILILVL